MANPALSHLAAAVDAANTTTVVSGSISPTGGALLCCAAACGGGSTVSSFSTTLTTSGSWYGPYTVDQGVRAVGIGFIKLDGTPGSGTVTATFSGKENRKCLHLSEATDYDTTTPLLNTTSNTATGNSTTPSVTLTSVDSGNTVFGAVATGTSPAPDQGSELAENSATPGANILSSAYDDTTPGNTFSWTQATGAWAVAAVEIKAATGDQSVTPSAVTAAFSVAAPTITPGNVKTTPNALSAAFSIAAPTNRLTQTPDPVVATFSIVAPTVIPGNVTITPSAVVATFTVAAPTIIAGPVSVTPTYVQATLSIAVPSVVAGAVTAIPPPVTMTASIAAPTIVPGDVSVTPSAVTATFSISVPTVTNAAAQAYSVPIFYKKHRQNILLRR